MRAAALILVLACLAGCGGGQATAEEIAEADAAIGSRSTIQPVDCSAGACR